MIQPMPSTRTSIAKNIAVELQKVPDAALFSHVYPDGDCLGSMLALGLCLEKLGKKVLYINASPLPENLKFLPGAGQIINYLPSELPETVIFIDCADLDRVGFSNFGKDMLAGKRVINIDHHISNDNFGTVNWIDYNAAATGEMIYQLIKKIGVTICKDIAVNLYTAIVTDTGRFSFSNTTPRSFRIAAELVKTGIDLVYINNIIFEKKTLSQTRLLYKALTNLELLQGGTIAIITLSKDDFEKCGAEESLSEGLVNYARNIENVEAAALLKEIDYAEIKVSFRSNSWLDVNMVAQKFGGGGHVRASGCTINSPLPEAKKIIISSLEEALNAGRNN